MKGRQKVTLRELQSLIGLLNFACSVVVPGRAFLRRLINLTIGVKRPHHYVRLTRQTKKDLQIWECFLESFNGRSLFLQEDWSSSHSLRLYTDAAQSSGFGILLVINGHMAHGRRNGRDITFAFSNSFLL